MSKPLPKGAQLATSAVAFDYLVSKVTKDDLAECVLALIALNLGACDEPPNLQQVIEHLDPVLRIRGRRLLSAHLAADKRKAPKLIEQFQRQAERYPPGSEHMETLIARQRFILDS